MDRVRDLHTDSCLYQQVQNTAEQVKSPETVRYSQKSPGGSVSSNTKMQKAITFLNQDQIDL